jgi:hypothetical protein
MRAKASVGPDRQAYLELLRTRVAVERQSLAVHTQQLRVQLSPQHWLDSASELKGGQLLAQGFSLAVQYPYLTAAVTSLLVRRRWRALKWTGLALAVWQTLYMTKERRT